MSSRRIQIDAEGDLPPRFDDEETLDDDGADGSGSLKFRPSNNNATDDLDPFMGVKVRRKASRHRDYIGDYIDVQSRPYLMKILEKQGDRKVLFADKVLKFTGSGKMKRRILLITDFAIYIVDPNSDALKRRIALAAVEKLCLSKLSDNFFAIIIPTEYDLLMASTRKTEVVTVLVDATKSASDYELEVSLSNRFEYNAAAELVKEVQFEEVEEKYTEQRKNRSSSQTHLSWAKVHHSIRRLCVHTTYEVVLILEGDRGGSTALGVARNRL